MVVGEGRRHDAITLPDCRQGVLSRASVKQTLYAGPEHLRHGRAAAFQPGPVSHGSRGWERGVDRWDGAEVLEMRRAPVSGVR